MLVVLVIIGGKLTTLLGVLLTHIFKKEVRFPRLLGMWIVGILMKNIPYNFVQFGRLECDGAIIDTINDLDDVNEHSSWKRSIANDHYGEEIVVKRSVIHIDNITHINMTNADLALCDPRYIGHELDPFISRSLVTAASRSSGGRPGEKLQKAQS